MKIVFTPTAREQFLDILAYIRGENPSAAVSGVDVLLCTTARWAATRNI